MGFSAFFCGKVYIKLDTTRMNDQKTPQLLLQEMAKIQQLERGKICIARQGADGPFYNHQSWENGKNVSRYIPRDQVPVLQEAIDGYHQFQKLTEQ